jgi:hypothetical protein
VIGASVVMVADEMQGVGFRNNGQCRLIAAGTRCPSDGAGQR